MLNAFFLMLPPSCSGISANFFLKVKSSAKLLGPSSIRMREMKWHLKLFRALNAWQTFDKQIMASYVCCSVHELLHPQASNNTLCTRILPSKLNDTFIIHSIFPCVQLSFQSGEMIWCLGSAISFHLLLSRKYLPQENLQRTLLLGWLHWIRHHYICLLLPPGGHLLYATLPRWACSKSTEPNIMPGIFYG